MEKLYKQRKESDVFFIRHAQSSYETYANILKSKDPQGVVNSEKQVKDDLTDEGIVMAKEEAVKFLSKLNSGEDILFFVSSSESRTLTTANIYKEIALKLGFEIIHQENVKCKEECADIRILVSLSLRNVRPFIVSIFTPEKYQTDINWDAVDEGMQKKWTHARKIVLEKDYGTWGDNFYGYADEVKSIFPELKTPLELFNSQFKNLQRLATFARDKISKEDGDKSVKILAFGHEDYMSVALEKKFFKKDLGECEVILL